MSQKSVKVLVLTLISIILTYYISVLMHEYGHATTAWLLGYKKSPVDIYIGNWLLLPVSEAVDYAGILASGHGLSEALIGISGISVTFFLFLISLLLLNRRYIQKHILLLSFFFWLANINLMEMFSYINRTFIMGDIGEFVQGLNISPLWIFIPGVFIVCLAIYRFYSVEIIKMFMLLPIKTVFMQRIFLWITFWPLILTALYWGRSLGWELLAAITNSVSVFIVILILILCDPARSWIRNNIEKNKLLQFT
jgi:hypothetical protein